MSSKRKTLGRDFSVTVRPRDGIEERFPNYITLLQEYVQRRCPSKYAFTVEKAGTAASHLQGLLRFDEDIRQDNLRRAFISMFPAIDDDELRSSIKIKDHDDFQYLIGYVTKESAPCLTNLSSEEMTDAKSYYMRSLAPTKIKPGMDPNDKLIDFMTYKSLQMGKDPKTMHVTSSLAMMVREGLIKPSQFVKVKREHCQEYWCMLHNMSLDDRVKLYEGRGDLGVEPHPVPL